MVGLASRFHHRHTLEELEAVSIGTRKVPAISVSHEAIEQEVLTLDALEILLFGVAVRNERAEEVVICLAVDRSLVLKYWVTLLRSPLAVEEEIALVMILLTMGPD